MAESKLTAEFLQALKEIEPALSAMQFKEHNFIQKGFAYYVTYKGPKVKVEFLFGPAEWYVEMIVRTWKRKYEFKDLLEIPPIANWVNSNRYKQEGERAIKQELLWALELLKVALPIIK